MVHTSKSPVTWFDRIDFNHVQSERFRVLQLLLNNIQTITEEVVVCTGHPAEKEGGGGETSGFHDNPEKLFTQWPCTST